MSLCVAIPAAAQRGAITQPLNLVQLTQKASTIVRGTVTGARVERHPEFTNLWTVVVTLRVHETLKGGHQENLTFRQYIWDVRDRYDAAGYKKGQELLLMMAATTQHGFTSPVGLEQGRFRVLPAARGKKVVVNGHGNSGLFRGMQGRGKQLDEAGAKLLEQPGAGPVDIAQFRQLVQHLVRSAQ